MTKREAELIDALVTLARWPRSDIGRERDIGEMKACAARTVCDALGIDRLPSQTEVIQMLDDAA